MDTTSVKARADSDCPKCEAKGECMGGTSMDSLPPILTAMYRCACGATWSVTKGGWR